MPRCKFPKAKPTHAPTIPTLPGAPRHTVPGATEPISTQALQLQMAQPAPSRRQARLPIAAEGLQAPFGIKDNDGDAAAEDEASEVMNDVVEAEEMDVTNDVGGSLLVAEVDGVLTAVLDESVVVRMEVGYTVEELANAAEDVALIVAFITIGTIDRCTLDVLKVVDMGELMV